MSTHALNPAVTYETAARTVEIAIGEAARQGVLAVVTVVDPSLTPIAYGKADGAPPHSVETSRRKAFTAASTRRPSALLSRELAVALEHGTGGLLTGIAGGVPLRFDGVHVGGLGIAGGTPAQDQQIAVAVLAALGADAAEEQA